MCKSMVLEFDIKGGTDITDGRRRQHLVVFADTESGQLLPVGFQPTVQHFEADTGCTCQFGFIHRFIRHSFCLFCSLFLSRYCMRVYNVRLLRRIASGSIIKQAKMAERGAYKKRPASLRSALPTFYST